MQTIIEFFSNLTDPAWIMAHGGLYIVVLIVFVETGFPFGFSPFHCRHGNRQCPCAIQSAFA